MRRKKTKKKVMTNEFEIPCLVKIEYNIKACDIHDMSDLHKLLLLRNNEYITEHVRM